MNFASFQIKGLKSHNQDAYFINEKENAIIVCDGLGSHHQSHFASQFVVRYFMDFISRENFFCSVKGVDDFFKKAQIALKEFCQQEMVSNKIGTTASICFVGEKSLFLGYLGDSKILVCGDSVVYVSTDHTLLGELETLGIDTEQRISSNSPLTKCITGTEDGKIYNPTIKVIPIREQLKLLIASDGLFDSIPLKNIESILEQKLNCYSINEKIRLSISEVKDDITCICGSIGWVSAYCDSSV